MHDSFLLILRCLSLSIVIIIVSYSAAAAHDRQMEMGRPRILSPHAGSTFTTDKLLVTIGTSQIGGYLGDKSFLLCIELHPALPRPTCYANYDLGSAEDQIFATVLNVNSPGFCTLEAFVARTQGNGTAVLSTSRHQVYFTIISSASCTPSLFPRKVYDSFSFFNELDLLELRFKELNDVVDYFILIESNITHSQRPKPFIYEGNRARFEAYWPKIIHVRVPGSYLIANSGESHWDRETLQRDLLTQALQAAGADPRDLVIVSDLDEVPRREVIQRTKQCREAQFPALLMMDWYLYNARWKAEVPWGIYGKEGAVIIEAAAVLNQQAQRTPTTARRFLRQGNLPLMAHLPWSIIYQAGWHFSSFGGAQALREKLVSYGDSPFADPFYLEAGRIERLQHFGLPYFYLRSMQSLEDSSFKYVVYETDEACRQDRGTEGMQGSSATTITTPQPPSLPIAMQEFGPGPIFDLLFPPPLNQSLYPHPWLDHIQSPAWARQDLLTAQFLFGPGGMTLPSASTSTSDNSRRRPRHTLHYDCSSDDKWLGSVQDFCRQHGGGGGGAPSSCLESLQQHVASACQGKEEEGSRGSLEVELDDTVLVDLQLPTSVVLNGSRDNDTSSLSTSSDTSTSNLHQWVIEVPSEITLEGVVGKKRMHLHHLAAEACLELKADESSLCLSLIAKGLEAYFGLDDAPVPPGKEEDRQIDGVSRSQEAATKGMRQGSLLLEPASVAASLSQ